MRFTRLRRPTGRDAAADGVSSTDLAVGQLLGLAASAGFAVELRHGRVEIIPRRAEGSLWPALKRLLDEVGAEAVVDFLGRTDPESRAKLSASA